MFVRFWEAAKSNEQYIQVECYLKPRSVSVRHTFDYIDFLRTNLASGYMPTAGFDDLEPSLKAVDHRFQKASICTLIASLFLKISLKFQIIVSNSAILHHSTPLFVHMLCFFNLT